MSTVFMPNDIHKDGVNVYYRQDLSAETKNRLTVLVTGTIGSGKSELCKFLDSKGCPTILADTVAKEVIYAEEHRQALVDELGATILHTKDGKVFYNFATIRGMLFDPENREVSAERRKFLQETFGEKILTEVKRRIATTHEEGHHVVFVENAIGLESGWTTGLPADKTVCVLASPALSKKRLESRNVSRDVLEAIASSQFPAMKKANHSGIIIVNNGQIPDLHLAGEELLHHLKATLT